MQVRQSFTASTQGFRPEMQDMVLREKGSGETHYFGVFDGHGNYGELLARKAAGAVQEVVRSAPTDGNALDRAKAVRDGLRALHKAISYENISRGSGTTASVVVVKKDKLAVAYLGDSEAVYYPDDRPAIRLTRPHNTSNVREVLRVEGMGFRILHGYFGGRIAISRAIGDLEHKFITPEAEIETLDFALPGTLVVASDGVWGSGVDNHDAVESMIREANDLAICTNRIVEVFAQQTHDNASAVVARIE